MTSLGWSCWFGDYLEAFKKLISSDVSTMISIKEHEGFVHVVLLLYLALIYSSSQKLSVINAAADSPLRMQDPEHWGSLKNSNLHL